jgi:hypothetical protein
MKGFIILYKIEDEKAKEFEKSLNEDSSVINYIEDDFESASSMFRHEL